MDALELLRQNQQKDLLRFITAGSVDDGKSTLIGRLLYEAKGIYEDQLASVRKASSQRGSPQGGELDFSLFTDGLKAEREQNITIDVAYRYFSTPRRKFIIADTPGHEQYTPNMVTGASTAVLMVILIDASKGLLDQSRRHAFVASLLGIQHVVVAVNKMDLVGYSAEVFERIRKDFTDFATKLQPHDVTFIPVSALKGDNIVTRSDKTPWYQGSTLLNHLETVHLASDLNLIDLRFPVQYVSRPDATWGPQARGIGLGVPFRGYMGSVASGVIRPGDEIVVLPSGGSSRVRAVLGPDGERGPQRAPKPGSSGLGTPIQRALVTPIPEAFPPMSCCVVLADEIDVSRGCMLVHPHNRPSLGDTFEAMLVWMAADPLHVARTYQIKQTTRLLLGEATAIRYRMDVNTLHRRDAAVLNANEVGRVVMKLSQPIAYDPYSLNRATGAFIVIDRVTHNTVGAGMILPRDPHEPPQGTPNVPTYVGTRLETPSARLLELQDSLRGQADHLLAASGLGGILQAEGFQPVGSYAMRTMTWRDLDFERTEAGPDWRRHWELGAKLAQSDWVWKMTCTHAYRQPGGADQGLYWGLRVCDPAGGPVWKIDLWTARAEEFARACPNRARWAGMLSDDTRARILAIKEAICSLPEYRKTLLSVHVYEAVLDADVRGIEEFHRWWQGRYGG